MRAFTVLILLVAFLEGSLEFAEPEKIFVKVGALFFKDEEDLELTFERAFADLNKIKLSEVRFEVTKRYVPEDDSLVLQRLTCELISIGVAAIFGPSSKASSDIVALIANSTGIPHMQFDWEVENVFQTQRNHRMTVNVAPSAQTLAKAYFDIIETNYAWNKFTVVYQTEEGFARLQNLMSISAIDPIQIKVRKLSDYESDYRVLWKETSETLHEHRIILDCEPSLLGTLLDSALEFNMLGLRKNWFLTHLDTHSSGLRSMYNQFFLSNITSVRLKTVDINPYERKKTRPMRVDELLRNQTMLPTLMYDAVILFGNAARMVIEQLKDYREPLRRCEMGLRGTSWYLGHYIVDKMKNISEDEVEPPFKTESMVIDSNGQRGAFNLEIYKPTTNERLLLWKPDVGVAPLNLRPELLEIIETEDFSQKTDLYMVATHVEKPYFMFKADHAEFRGIDKYEGYVVDLMRKLSELMEFRYDFTVTQGNGKYTPETREWNGIIGHLIRHQAEIGVADITITQQRREVVDFTVPFMQLGISILYYKKPPEPADIYTFLKPFANDVWIYLVFTQMVVTLMLIFVARISKYEWNSPNAWDRDPDEVENIWHPSNSLWLMVGSIMQQGSDILPRGPPMRILTGVWWFFALMMFNTYTANLAAVLTSSKYQNPITSLEKLVDQDKVKFGTVIGGSTSLFFSESNDSLYQRAWNQMKTFQPSAFTETNQEGVDRVRKGKGSYAFLMETTGLSYNMAQYCELTKIGGQIGEKHYGMAVPMDALYRTNLSVSLLSLSEKGELYKLKKHWWKNESVVCEKKYEVDGDELSIMELGGIFLTLCGGIILSILLGIFEFLFHVQQVAVDEGVTPREAFKAELLFVLKFWIKRKPLRIAQSSRKTSSSTSRRSSGQSRSQKSGTAKASTKTASTKRHHSP